MIRDYDHSKILLNRFSIGEDKETVDNSEVVISDSEDSAPSLNRTINTKILFPASYYIIEKEMKEKGKGKVTSLIKRISLGPNIKSINKRRTAKSNSSERNIKIKMSPDELEIEEEGNTLHPNKTISSLKDCISPSCNIIPENKIQKLIKYEHEELLPDYYSVQKQETSYKELKKHMQNMFECYNNVKESVVYPKQSLGKMNEMGELVLTMHELYKENKIEIEGIVNKKDKEKYYKAIEESYKIIKLIITSSVNSKIDKEGTIDRRSNKYVMNLFNIPSILVL